MESPRETDKPQILISEVDDHLGESLRVAPVLLNDVRLQIWIVKADAADGTWTGWLPYGYDLYLVPPLATPTPTLVLCNIMIRSSLWILRLEIAGSASVENCACLDRDCFELRNLRDHLS